MSLESMKVSELKERTQEGLATVLGEETLEAHKEQTLESFTGSERELAVAELGRQEITETYRQLILRVISELWIDYLTKMEALRVSIGLEAYAQRDPLVQYKTQASKMFQQLFNDMRMSVVTRMFTYRPRQLQTAPAPQPPPRAAQIQRGGEQAQPGQAQQPQLKGKRKRKRKRKGKKK